MIIKSGAVLIVDGPEIIIEDLELDGALVIKSSDALVVRGKKAFPVFFRWKFK